MSESQDCGVYPLKDKKEFVLPSFEKRVFVAKALARVKVHREGA
jgi:hypothetical protein